jgi:hypothetical protein
LDQTFLSSETFLMNLHDVRALAGPKFVPLTRGKVQTFLLHTSESRADQNLEEAVAFDKRRCVTFAEKLSSLTLNYTQSSCILECQLRLAMASCNVTCVPWNYPPLDERSFICSAAEAMCVQDLIQTSDDSLARCLEEDTLANCPVACDSFSYDPLYLSEELHSTEECLEMFPFSSGSSVKSYIPSDFSSTIGFQPPQSPLEMHIDELHSRELTNILMANTGRRFKDNPLMTCNLLMRKSAMVHIKTNAERIRVITLRRQYDFSATLAALGLYRTL